MSKYVRHKKKDANHREIVQFLTGMGFIVEDVSALPDIGFDLLVIGSHGVYRAVEVKDGSKPPSARQLTRSEQYASIRHGRRFVVVKDISDVEKLIRDIRNDYC